MSAPKKNRPADCHPDRPHFGKGLCANCYQSQWSKSKRKGVAPENRVPRGPSGNAPTPILSAGLELAGQSVNSDGKGNIGSVWDLGRRAGDPDPAPIPPDFAAQSIAQMTRNGDEVVRWTSYDRAKADQHAALMAAWDRHAENYEGKAALSIAPPADRDANTLAVYVVGDHHLGMLAWWRETGESWDLAHGVQYLTAAQGELVARMPASERALIINVGDFKHAPDGRQVTPGHGHKLDVDGRNAKVDDAATALLTGITDLTLAKHRHVTWHHLPGNHDPEVAAALARVMRAWYRNEPRVTIADAYRSHQYYQFGVNLLGMHHGDTTPAAELPGVMAVDCGPGGFGIDTGWGTTTHRRWICGHVHHKVKYGATEQQTVLVEYFNILPPGDAWHVSRFRAQRYMTGLVLDREYGEVGRCQVGIEKVRALLASEAR